MRSCPSCIVRIPAYGIKKLKRFGMGSQIRKSLYSCTTESILTGFITACYGNCLASDRKALQRVVRMTQYITGARLPAIQAIYTRRCETAALYIFKDSSRSRQTFLSATAWQVAPMHQVWNQQDPKQFLPQSHKTTK